MAQSEMNVLVCYVIESRTGSCLAWEDHQAHHITGSGGDKGVYQEFGMNISSNRAGCLLIDVAAEYRP